MAKKVFVSWSGDRAFVLAEMLERWLPTIVPGTRAFYSPEIGGGVIWLNKLLEELKSAQYGIICVAKENQTSPWLHFEAGALWQRGGKQIPVCPLLLDLPVRSLKAPLNFFQAKRFDEKGILDIARDIARGSGITGDRLKRNTKAAWPQLKKDVRDELKRI